MQKTEYEVRSSDWSSDVCSSDLHKIRKDGGPDGRGVGFYFRNVTEVILFGVRGKGARTLQPGRSQVNFLATRKREHSRKPDEQNGRASCRERVCQYV